MLFFLLRNDQYISLNMQNISFKVIRLFLKATESKYTTILDTRAATNKL